MLNKADVRDGRPYPPDLSNIALEDGVRSALVGLSTIIPLLFVVTNQPDVARGTLARSSVEKANRYLAERLPLTAFYTCCHDDADDCPCRKPRAGLFLQASAEYDLDLSRCYLVGDRWRDIDAGARAGTTTILIDRGYAERAPTCLPDMVVTSTVEAVDAIVAFEATRSPARETSVS